MKSVISNIPLSSQGLTFCGFWWEFAWLFPVMLIYGKKEKRKKHSPSLGCDRLVFRKTQASAGASQIHRDARGRLRLGWLGIHSTSICISFFLLHVPCCKRKDKMMSEREISPSQAKGRPLKEFSKCTGPQPLWLHSPAFQRPSPDVGVGTLGQGCFCPDSAGADLLTCLWARVQEIFEKQRLQTSFPSKTWNRKERQH